MAASIPTTDALTEKELTSLKGQKATPSGDPASRFVQQCQNWLAAWIEANAHPLHTNSIPANQILIFIFAEAPEVEKPKFANLQAEWTRFHAAAHDQVAQGIVLCNENLRTCYRILASVNSLNDALTLVTEHLQADSTFVIASLSQRRMLYHSPGVEIDDWCQTPTQAVLKFSTDALSAAKISADVDEFHEMYLRLAKSAVASALWRGKNHPYKLNPNPEKTIQLPLFLHLRASYKHLSGIVDEEVNDTGGRCDIRIQWPSTPSAPFQPYTSTMLELKVLYEDQGTSTHRDWVISGITQAHDYRTPNSEAAYACIFDARRDQSDQMADLDVIATAKNVGVRRYLMESPKYPAPTAAKKSANNASKKVPKKSTKNPDPKGVITR